MRITRVFTMMVVLCLAVSAFADNIYNINFVRADTHWTDAYRYGQGVVGEADDYWNLMNRNLNQSNPGTSGVLIYDLLDASGNASSVKLDRTTVTTTGSLNTATPTNFVFEDYWSAANVAQTITIRGLDDSKTYDIYIYSQRDNSGAPFARKIRTTIGGVTLTPVSSAWYSTYVLNENYVEFDDLQSSSGNIAITFQSTDTGSAPINAIQIVEIPEPATMALLGIGGAIVLIRKKNMR